MKNKLIAIGIMIVSAFGISCNNAQNNKNETMTTKDFFRKHVQLNLKKIL